MTHKEFIRFIKEYRFITNINRLSMYMEESNFHRQEAEKIYDQILQSIEANKGQPEQ